MTAHPSRFRPRLLWVLALSAALTGCATMQSHDKLATDMQKTLEVLQLGSERMQKRLTIANLLATVATTAAVLAFGVAAYALAN